MTSSPNASPARRPPLLPDLLAQVTVERVLDTARRIEAKRSDGDDARLAAHHGFGEPMLWVTPYMWQAAMVAMRRGVVAFDRLERDFLEVPADWVHPELTPASYQIKRGPESVKAPPLWPFAQDMVVADFESRQPYKWWSHGLVHTLVGFGWWPGMSEWELMAMARLSEVLASAHWYFLSELGRLAKEDMPLDLSWLRGQEAARYRQLEERSQRADVRKARLGDPVASGITESMLEMLRYEAYAYRSALWSGDMIEPSDALYFDYGEAGEYAKVHIRRLGSDAHARWREHCLVPERDYATSSDGFERRASAVLKDLFYFTEPGAPDARLRGRRALQDVGWRTCHHAALVGDSVGHTTALTALSDAIAALDGEVDGDAVVAGALESVHAALGAGARSVLALGYRPTLDAAREPGGAREARVHALQQRAWRIHPIVGAALEGLPALGGRLVAEPRTRDLAQPLVAQAELALRASELALEAYGFVGWLAVPYTLWFQHGAEQAQVRWSYRAARRKMPEDPVEWDDYAVTWNQYLQRLPLPFDVRWSEEVRKATPGSLKRFKPRPAAAICYSIIGPGRDGPVYLPITPHLNVLLQALRVPRRLGELARSRDVGVDFLRQAIADEAVLVFHQPKIARDERNMDVFESAMEQMSGVPQRREEPGPWNDEGMAKAYAAYCERSSLYRDTSAALVEMVGIPSDAWVGELGSGTGETSAEILARLGPKGRLVGTDPAMRMLEHLVRRFADDPRAAFVLGAARALGFSSSPERRFDRIIANSSLVLAADVTDELAVACGALEHGGKIAFSMPAEFVGVNAHQETEAAKRFYQTVAEVQAEMGVARDVKPVDPALGTTDALSRAMSQAGFVDVRLETYRRPWTAGEYLDWLALPVIAKGLVGAANEQRADELIARLRERIDPSAELESVWMMAAGTRPRAEGTDEGEGQ